MPDKSDKNIEVIISTIQYVIFQNESFYILELEDRIKAKGNILDNMFGDITGLRYKFEGYFTTDKFGKIFVIEKASMQTHELYFFLSKIVKGIGEKLALTLTEKFGDELEEIIENNPDKLMEISGIKEKKKNAIVKQWNEFSHLRKISKFLGEYGISANLIAKVYSFFGEHSVEIIKNNPYSLTQIQGIGFKKADEIALKAGIEHDSPERILACANYIVEKEAFESGHTYLLKDELISKIREILDLDNDAEYFMESIRNTPDILIDGDRISLRLMKFYEDTLYDYFTKNSDYETSFFDSNYIENYLNNYEIENNIKLSETQKKSIYEALNRKVFALTGYAGTGKSTISKIFMELLNRLFEDEIVGCAMSGIAARRLSSLTGFPAYTIHSLLKYDGQSFEYNAANPLPYKVIILDEAGMVNSYLFFSLVTALSDEAIFIMVGDDAQLPPIGPGNVFSDIVSKNLVPFVKLDKVFRQSEDSVINIFANIIRKGEIPDDYKKSYLDWRFRTINLENDYSSRNENNFLILERVLNIAQAYKERGFENILTDLQILVPQKKGILGVENLNLKLQEVYNPINQIDGNMIKKNDKIFAVGDKVVHLKNADMDIFLTEDFNNYELDEALIKKERIFNGTLGIIKKIDLKKEKAYVKMITDLVVVYDFNALGDILDHAYALTVHKAQGSEFHSVILPLTMSNYIMLDNQWLYTAVTRAKKGIFIVGEEKAFEKACVNISKRNRNTWIKLIS
jgi:exodeoxyribonuclease V alpha subunit